MPTIEWEWKFNPATMLAIVTAAFAVLAGFIRADVRDQQTQRQTEENTRAIQMIAEAINQNALNDARLTEIVNSNRQRIERLER